MDQKSFQAVHSIEKIDSNTPDSRYIVKALPHNVPTVQRLLLLLTSIGVKAEAWNPSAPSQASPNTNPAAFQMVQGKKAKKKGGLAAQSQAGLSASIAKAGQAPAHRVHGQCDYFGANLPCPRGDECRFTCYNGPRQ